MFRAPFPPSLERPFWFLGPGHNNMVLRCASKAKVWSCMCDVLRCETLKPGKSARAELFDILGSDKHFWMETWVGDHESAI
jgi:hypothetical protein